MSPFTAFVLGRTAESSWIRFRVRTAEIGRVVQRLVSADMDVSLTLLQSEFDRGHVLLSITHTDRDKAMDLASLILSSPS